jgi:hypothetical protein
METSLMSIDIRGHTFLCPIKTPTNVLVDKSSCISLTISSMNPKYKDILNLTPASVTITGTNIGVCGTGSLQCIYNYPAAKYAPEIVTATSSSPTTVVCPIPLFKGAGTLTVCVGQFGRPISSTCLPLKVEYNCTSRCAPHGTCDKVNNKCICSLGYKGKPVGVNCNFHNCTHGCNECPLGNCANPGGYCNVTAISNVGECICTKDAFGVALFIGPYCEFTNKKCTQNCTQCPANCTKPSCNCVAHGQCDGFVGECQCTLGYQGKNCSEIRCPDCYPRGGYCPPGNGTCLCNSNYTGPLCNVPLGKCAGNCYSNQSRGRCNKEDQVCECYPPYFGDNCQFTNCTLNCSYPNGICNYNNGTCTCAPNYSGTVCTIFGVPCTLNCGVHGICIPDGTCRCKYPFTGLDCSKADCPKNCSWNLGHGNCDVSTGKCNCTYPWSGPACANPIAPCPNDCSGFETACNHVTGVCNCPYSNYNYDCSVRLCPKNCSGHGKCSTVGTCSCDIGWSGSACDKVHLDCPIICKNGPCDFDTGKCKCKAGFSGLDCSNKTCLRDCSFPNGTCNVTTGVCKCDYLYEGQDCSRLACLLGSCINNGSCNPSKGTCNCGQEWTGDTCALIRCPGDCSGNGVCVGGVCTCNGRWSGESCNSEKPDVVLIVLLAIGLFLAAILIIVGAFLLWRHMTISKLKEELDNAPQANHELDDISSGDDE